MLVLPIFLPLRLPTMFADAISDLQRRLPSLTLSVSDLLAATRPGYRGVELGVRVHFETTQDGQVSRLRLEVAPPMTPADDLAPHTFLDPAEAAGNEAGRLTGELCDLYVIHEVARRLKDKGRELAHIPLPELDELISATESARSDYDRLTSRLDEWTLHEVAVREKAIRAVTSNQGGPAAYEKAKPLRNMLAREVEQVRVWWDGLSDDGRSTWSQHVPEDTPNEERMVLAYRDHLRFTDWMAERYLTEARILRAVYQVAPSA